MVDLVRTPEGYRPPNTGAGIVTASNIGTGAGESVSGVAAGDLQIRTITSSDGSVTVSTAGQEIDLTIAGTPAPASAGPAVYNRSGQTGNFTWLRVGETSCAAPTLTRAGVGFPLTSDGSRKLTGVRFRTSQAAASAADLEIYRYQGNAATGSAVLVATVVIPGGSNSTDQALAVTIPSGDYVIAARRGAGGVPAADRWRDVTVSVEIE